MISSLLAATLVAISPTPRAQDVSDQEYGFCTSAVFKASRDGRQIAAFTPGATESFASISVYQDSCDCFTSFTVDHEVFDLAFSSTPNKIIIYGNYNEPIAELDIETGSVLRLRSNDDPTLLALPQCTTTPLPLCSGDKNERNGFLSVNGRKTNHLIRIGNTEMFRTLRGKDDYVVFTYAWSYDSDRRLFQYGRPDYYLDQPGFHVFGNGDRTMTVKGANGEIFGFDYHTDPQSKVVRSAGTDLALDISENVYGDRSIRIRGQNHDDEICTATLTGAGDTKFEITTSYKFVETPDGTLAPYWLYSNANESNSKLMVLFHGGPYRSGGPSGQRDLVTALASEYDVAVVEFAGSASAFPGVSLRARFANRAAVERDLRAAAIIAELEQYEDYEAMFVSYGGVLFAHLNAWLETGEFDFSAFSKLHLIAPWLDVRLSERDQDLRNSLMNARTLRSFETIWGIGLDDKKGLFSENFLKMKRRCFVETDIYAYFGSEDPLSKPSDLGACLERAETLFGDGVDHGNVFHEVALDHLIDTDSIQLPTFASPMARRTIERLSREK